MRVLVGAMGVVGVAVMLSLAEAGNIDTPPVLPEHGVDLQRYLRQVYDNWQRLEVVTSNPNGSRRGVKGRVLFFETTTDKICVNVDGSTTWSCADVTAP